MVYQGRLVLAGGGTEAESVKTVMRLHESAGVVDAGSRVRRHCQVRRDRCQRQVRQRHDRRCRHPPAQEGAEPGEQLLKGV
jgi:hypothetical protein